MALEHETIGPIGCSDRQPRQMTDTAEALTMLMPYPADAMEAYAVSTEVN